MICKAGLRHHPVRLRRPRLSETLSNTCDQPPLQPVILPPPDLASWYRTNTGTAGVMTFDSGRSGPDIAIVAMVHGNEYAGGHVLNTLVRNDPTPSSGRLTLIIANLAAFARFNPGSPATARYVDEDLNRVWNSRRLHGPERSSELARARDIEPFIRRADILLDLHSTLWPSGAFFIAPPVRRSWELAQGLASIAALPSLLLTDLGHPGGSRLIEHDHFAATVGSGRGCLLEGGPHWAPQTVGTMEKVVNAFLQHAEDFHLKGTARGNSCQKPHTALVTDHVICRSSTFSFTRPWVGNTSLPRAGTVIAHDGNDLICTPYDDCLLIAPNHAPRIGQLAVRLARNGVLGSEIYRKTY